MVSRLLVGRSLARLVVCCLGWVALGCHGWLGRCPAKYEAWKIALGLKRSLGAGKVLVALMFFFRLPKWQRRLAGRSQWRIDAQRASMSELRSMAYQVEVATSGQQDGDASQACQRRCHCCCCGACSRGCRNRSKPCPGTSLTETTWLLRQATQNPQAALPTNNPRDNPAPRTRDSFAFI